MYKYILIPGRHHAVTKFQIDYLQAAINTGEVSTINGTQVQLEDHAEVVWAISSANHANTRRNPIPGFRRLGLIEYTTLKSELPSVTFLIPNMDYKRDFAHYITEEIFLQSNGAVALTPDNCLVACSTPAVIDQYEKLGYSILPVELTDKLSNTTKVRRPWELIEDIVTKGTSWHDDKKLKAEFALGSVEYYDKYNLSEAISDIFQDPLQEASGDGDLTTSRDYETYRQAFEQNAFRKVDQFKDFVVPGRILDIGSATGQTIKLLTEVDTLAESDFYGVEAARPLYAICQQRKENGAFGSANVFFYQRNIMQSTLFPPNSLNTIITMALTHEIESYLGRKALLDFVSRMYTMTAPGGVYINYDVAAPTNKDLEVYVQFTEDDGVNPEDVTESVAENELTEFLAGLSTKSRFLRFVNDFRHDEGDQMNYRIEKYQDEEYYVMRHADLCDFLAKKDYVENWHSEMHERFCYWEYEDWTTALEEVGFEIQPTSRPIQNDWLIENRFAPAAIVKHLDNGVLVDVASPVTNVLLIAQKPV